MLSRSDFFLNPRPHARGVLGVAPVGSGGGGGSTVGVYGPAFNIDTKSNYQAGWTNSAIVAMRFRAATTTTISEVLWQVRRGSVYSAGTGGVIEISIQPDDGSAGHFPNGTKLATVNFTPTNSPTGGFVTRSIFASPPSITAGQLYHVVFTNVDANQTVNYVSINFVYTYNALVPHQPAFADVDFGSSYKDPTWRGIRETADVDVVCADGSHLGSAYIQAGVSGIPYGVISGNSMVRERFTVNSGDHNLSSLWARIGRQSGTDPITLGLYSGSGAGTLIEQQSVSTSGIINWTPGADAQNGTWFHVNLSTPRLVSNGGTYFWRISTPSTSTYSMVIMLSRDGSDDGTHYMKSRSFTEGVAEKSTDGGSTWSAIYGGFTNNTQTYAETV